MAKRGRQKNRTGNSKRPPAPASSASSAAGAEGATAAKLSSVKPAPLAALGSDAERPSARLSLVRDEPALVRDEPAGRATEIEPDSSPASGSKMTAEAKAKEPDGTPSPTSLDLVGDDERLERAEQPEEVGEFEESFFSSFPGEQLHAEDDHHEPDPRLTRLHEPDVVARRARMRKHVAWGLALCAAIFFLAVGRAALQPHGSASNASGPPRVAPAPVAAEPKPEPAPVVSVAPVVPVREAPAASAAATPTPAASAESVASPEPVAVAAPAASAAPTAVAAPAPSAAPVAAPASGDAKALRAQARKLLESGKAKDAIEPALQSTALEPEHAEGWLLLGASYLDRGRGAEARQAFQTCVAQAKRGPRGECAAMLR